MMLASIIGVFGVIAVSGSLFVLAWASFGIYTCTRAACRDASRRAEAARTAVEMECPPPLPPSIV